MKDKTFEDFKEAVDSGNVIVPISEDESDVLISDGVAALHYFYDEGMGHNFTLVDGGGFSSVSFFKEDWEKMKLIVDSKISSRQN